MKIKNEANRKIKWLKKCILTYTQPIYLYTFIYSINIYTHITKLYQSSCKSMRNKNIKELQMVSTQLTFIWKRQSQNKSTLSLYRKATHMSN